MNMFHSLTYRFVFGHSNSDITAMNVLVVIGLVAIFGVELGTCCSCAGTFKDFMCSADFVAKVIAENDQDTSMNGPFQIIQTVEAYKGRDDILLAYSGRSMPGMPMSSCDGSPLKKGVSYILSGFYYDADGNDAAESILYSGCQVMIEWDRVTEEQFYFMEALRDGEAEC